MYVFRCLVSQRFFGAFIFFERNSIEKKPLTIHQAAESLIGQFIDYPDVRFAFAVVQEPIPPGQVQQPEPNSL